MLSTPKVSVIIPVYKVEKYLQECLDSVLGQTLKNMEIILVDDGSPDKCPQICDDYALKDCRIKVIHQENQGSSVARNNGMKIAKGDYVAFVDSDDIISPYMFEVLVGTGRNADIIECEVTKDKKYLSRRNVLIKKKEYKSGILAQYLKTNKVGVWCRIYKREIIDGLYFEDGAFSEDVMWSYNVFEKCKTYVIIDSVLYYWRQCSDSLSKSCIKHFKSQSERLSEIIENNHPELLPIINNHLIIVKINMLTNAARYGFVNTEIEQQFNKKEKSAAIRKIRSYLIHIMTDPFFRWQTRTKALMISVSYSLYAIIIKMKYGK